MSWYCASASAFFFGIALALALPARILTRIPGHRKRLPGDRIPGLCVALSIALASLALALIFLASPEDILVNPGNGVFFFCLVILGAAVGLWRNIALPVILGLYLCYGIWGAVSLNRVFGPGKLTLLIQIDSGKVTVNGTPYPVSGEWSVALETYTPPRRFLVPYPFSLIRFAGIAPRNRALASDSGLTPESLSQDKRLLTARIPAFTRGLLASKVERRYNFPDQERLETEELLPAQYLLTWVVREGSPAVTVTKLF